MASLVFVTRRPKGGRARGVVTLATRCVVSWVLRGSHLADIPSPNNFHENILASLSGMKVIPVLTALEADRWLMVHIGTMAWDQLLSGKNDIVLSLGSRMLSLGLCYTQINLMW